MLQRAQQVRSCVMVCTASAMLRYGVLGECRSRVTACLVSDVSRYNVLGQHNWKVLSHVTVCLASAVSC